MRPVDQQDPAPNTPRPIPGAMLIPIESVERDPNQPRRDWRHDHGYQRLDDLTRSVKEFGILQPLVVRRSGDRFMVIAGGRRLVAARRAGLTHVPVVVREEEGTRLRVLQLIENMQRQQLTPLDEARAYQELMEIEGLTIGGIATRVHVSTQTVRDKLRLLHDQVLADAVERRQISATAAREINKLPDDVAEDLRHRVQVGERLQVADLLQIRAKLHTAGIVNPRWNPRSAAARMEEPKVMAAAAAAPTPKKDMLLEQEAAEVLAGRSTSSPLFYDSSLLPLSEPRTRRGETPTERAGGDNLAQEQAAEMEGALYGALNRAMAEPRERSLRALVVRIPWNDVEALLEYGVAHGWSAAGLLHMARTEHQKLTQGTS